MRLVLCTCPQEKAKELVDFLLRERLAPCVNVVSSVFSKYTWKGKLVEDQEALLFIKTRDELMFELIQKLKLAHPYEVPEIISFDIREGNADYFKWIVENTKEPFPVTMSFEEPEEK